MNLRTPLLHICLSLCGIGLMLSPGVVAAQTLSGGALVTALRQGGYIILMRHASSPQQPPSRENANPDNVKVERQLDDAGRSTATAMGKALRDLKIPVGDVLSSPTYRALETARLAQWTNVTPVPELGDNGQGMTRVVPEEQAAWLKRRVTQTARGTNTILITHLPNISRAFPESSSGLSDGEAMVFSPDEKGGATVVARITIEEWPRLTP